MTRRLPPLERVGEAFELMRSGAHDYVPKTSLARLAPAVTRELQEAAAKSNAAIAKFPGKLTWEHSYVVQDKTFCIYLADSAETVMKHAKESGFPADKVTEVRTVIEPLTAE